MSIHLEIKAEETRKEVVQLWLVVEPLEKAIKELAERLEKVEKLLENKRK